MKIIINALLNAVKQLAEVMTLTIFCLMVFALFALQVIECLLPRPTHGTFFYFRIPNSSMYVCISGGLGNKKPGFWNPDIAEKWV